MRLTVVNDEATAQTLKSRAHLDPIKQQEAKMAVKFHTWLADKQILPGGIIIESGQRLAGELTQRKFGLKLLVVSDRAFDVLPLLKRSGFELSPRDYRLTLGFTLAVRDFKNADNRIRVLAWNVLPPQDPDRRTYYQGAHGALYIFDVLNKEGLAHLPTLHEIIQQTSGNIPSILIGHKNQHAGRRKVTRKQGKLLAQKLGISYYETRNPKGPTLSAALEELIPRMLGFSTTSE